VDEELGLLDELMHFAPVPEEGPFAGLAQRLDVPVEVLLLVSRVTAAPLVSDAAMRLTGFGHSPTPSQRNCPVCGAAPGLAELRPDDGARMLHCSLCAYAWPFGRLDCPFCDGRDPTGIEKLSVEDDPARWLEACRRCRRYLKTVDRRELPPQGPFFPLVEEVANLYLDLLAEREGCLPGAPYAAVR
jgi:formate dehydrogenase maturation protein FdhE